MAIRIKQFYAFTYQTDDFSIEYRFWKYIPGKNGT